MAGITMTLYNSANTRPVAGVDPVETHASGFYEFEGLAEGNYTVRAGSASNARAIHAIAQDEDGEWEFVTSKSATAEDYTVSVDEADLGKPYWVRQASGTMGNGTTMARGTGLNPPLDTYYNFALVYTDGQLTGSVENISDGSGDIDLVFSSPFPFEADRELTTDRRGNFEISDLMEAIGYTAVIEDAGFAAPCMNADTTMADDDNFGDHDEDANTPDVCLNPADTELTADVLGEDDHQNMGKLYVYNTTMGADDMVTHVLAKGVATPGADVANLGDSVTSITQDASGTTELSGITGTITYASATVRVVVARMDADASTAVMMGTTACPGGVCTLPFNETTVPLPDAIPDPVATEITVMVTAENGYNDHAYTFSVSRANPVDNVLERNEIVNQAGQQAGGTGGDGQTVGNPWQVTTAGADSSAITLTFNLQDVGEGDDAYCGQSVSVKINGGADQEAIEDTDTDACDDEQYRLSAGTSGTVYEITIMSEDGVAKKHYINLTVGS